MNKEPIQVTRSSMPEFNEYAAEIKDLWDTHWLTNMGVKHETLQKRLKDYLAVEQLALFTNGHLALECAIAAFGLAGEVITTPFTFPSTTHAIVRNGLIPVFCDIDPVTHTLDPAQLESLITERTSAIIPVHVYGTICPVTEIEHIAKKYDLKVIYDAAHAFGEEIKGDGIGQFGDAVMFSFHATKVFNTIEGGAVSFKEKSLETKLNHLKNFGITGPESVEYIGGNAKMNEFQAAMGICNLPHVDAEIVKRKSISDRYREKLSCVEGLTIREPQQHVKSNYAYFPVLFEEEAGWNRDRAAYQLEKEGIYARKYFYPLVSDYDCYHYLKGSQDTPVARRIASKVLTLPLYPDLSLEEADRICDVLLKTRTLMDLKEKKVKENPKRSMISEFTV